MVINRVIANDDAAKWGLLIGRERFLQAARRSSSSDTTGIRVFQDRDGGSGNS